MVRYLLDTNVISETSRAKGSSPIDEVLDRVPPEDLFLSVISLGEMQTGISLLSDGRRRHTVEDWFLKIRLLYADRVLTIDSEIALIWGELAAATRQAGHNILAADLLIAATAMRHELTVMTRNVRDFIPTGVPVVNPWDL